MAEYIDKEQLLDFLQIIPIDLGYREIEDVKQFVKEIPAADVVEVVRCKDCLWFVPSAYDDFWCSAKEAGITKGMCMPGGNDYCSDGKRRQ